MGFIFRKIAGRIVPIRVGSKVVDNVSLGSKEIVTTAIHKGQEIGRMSAFLEKAGKTSRAIVNDVRVAAHAQRKGVSHAMFGNMLSNLKKLGYKFLHGELRHPAQVSIRQKYNTRFYDAYGVRSRVEKAFKFVKPDKAAARLRENGYVNAITRIGGKKK